MIMQDQITETNHMTVAGSLKRSGGFFPHSTVNTDEMSLCHC